MKINRTVFLLLNLSTVAQALTIRGNKNVIIQDGETSENELDGHRVDPERRAKKSKQTAESKSRFIVRYKTNKGRKMALNLASNVYYQFSHRNAVVVDLNEADLKSLRASKDHVLAVDADTVVEPLFTNRETVDPHNNSDRRLTQTTPYGIPMVQADQVSVQKKKIDRPRVCLVDTGVLYTHPDLPQKLMRGRNRYSTSFNTKLRWKDAVDGHGTCLAGILSANMTNNIGIRGVGDIPLFITRGMNDQAEAMQSDILAALDQCEASGSKIISLSFGGSGMSTAFTELLDHLYDDLGVLIFASSGNNAQEYAMYPAAYPKVISVGAVNASGQHWFASNWGPSLELMAPGDNVLCTGISNGLPVYEYYSGTSMSSPYAAGVAALIWGYFPTCTNSQIRYALAYTAKDIGAPGCDQVTGNGIVQAKAAFDFLSANPCSGASWGLNVNASSGCGMVNAQP